MVRQRPSATRSKRSSARRTPSNRAPRPTTSGASGSTTKPSSHGHLRSASCRPGDEHPVLPRLLQRNAAPARRAEPARHRRAGDRRTRARRSRVTVTSYANASGAAVAGRRRDGGRRRCERDDRLAPGTRRSRCRRRATFTLQATRAATRCARETTVCVHSGNDGTAARRAPAGARLPDPVRRPLPPRTKARTRSSRRPTGVLDSHVYPRGHGAARCSPGRSRRTRSVDLGRA